MSDDTKKEIDAHLKELERRKALSLPERVKLGREDAERAHKKKVETLKKVPEKIKQRESLCKGIEADVISLAAKLKTLDNLDVQLYLMLMDPDCLFNDCPISPSRTYHWLKEFMIKLDMDFLGVILDGKATVKGFYERAQEASGWITRFAKPKPLPKFGMAAITEEE